MEIIIILSIKESFVSKIGTLFRKNGYHVFISIDEINLLLLVDRHRPSIIIIDRESIKIVDVVRFEKKTDKISVHYLTQNDINKINIFSIVSLNII